MFFLSVWLLAFFLFGLQTIVLGISHMLFTIVHVLFDDIGHFVTW